MADHAVIEFGHGQKHKVPSAWRWNVGLLCRQDADCVFVYFHLFSMLENIHMNWYIKGLGSPTYHFSRFLDGILFQPS